MEASDSKKGLTDSEKVAAVGAIQKKIDDIKRMLLKAELVLSLGIVMLSMDGLLSDYEKEFPDSVANFVGSDLPQTSDSRSPQEFARDIRRKNVTGVDPRQWEILELGESDDNPEYADVWKAVTKSAVITNPKDSTKRFKVLDNGAMERIAH